MPQEKWPKEEEEEEGVGGKDRRLLKEGVVLASPPCATLILLASVSMSPTPLPPVAKAMRASMPSPFTHSPVMGEMREGMEGGLGRKRPGSTGMGTILLPPPPSSPSPPP